MSKRAFSRSFDMPTIDPDKEDETPEIIITATDIQRKWDAAMESIAKEMGIPPEVRCPVVVKSGCDHKWKSYTGLSEQFEYCEICDERK